MKLYLNKTQKDYLLEVLRASENNAITGQDFELAVAFQELYEKIKPENTAYVKLDRGESETILEFCEIVKSSLDNALKFTSTKDSEGKQQLLNEIESTRNEIENISDQLREKIRSNS